MDSDLNFLVKQFEEFAKHNKLVGSPIDRLFNQKLDFKINTSLVELTDSPNAMKLQEQLNSKTPNPEAFSSGIEPMEPQIRSLPFVSPPPNLP